ncbi:MULTISPECIES: hypothetical protein [Klebsiella pneumoniae complex]|uniref:hypothetical protein n=1 Tax=Klebsiella pneumoniae complex TaxID=3390273 RepID=UPI0010F7FC9F|nr:MULTISPECIES: hypothetical protein [Klebsiella]MCI8018419.1 hypothetical protein [Klebsiella pneumoniae]MDQ5262915.1 hypothetical protein [Klebsiella pneumoniae]HCB2065842.1 hypothetical protein [Klebsiella pneumoniae]
MTTDITELAQRLATCAKEDSYPVLSPAECGALVEALEKAQTERDEFRRRFNLERSILEDADKDLETLRRRIAELESSGIAPGILRCSECSFVQTKNIISVTADIITTVESESEPCPNGCGQLQPVTWKALAIQLMFTAKQCVSDLLEYKKRIAELESFRTAYMEWSDKTDWVQTDRRFGVVKPLGKHRADVLKEYIEHLESRTVKLPAACADDEYFIDGVFQPLRYERDVERALRAAGIKVAK